MPSRPRVGFSRPALGLASLVVAVVVGLSGTALNAAVAPQRSVIAGSLLSPQPGPAGSILPSQLNWSGIAWTVSPDGAQGPENVPLTNSSNAVFVDSQGRLHLNIIQLHGAWQSVELRSQYPVSYGTYQLVVDSATARFSDRTVFGMFVYRPHTKTYTNEIDIEDSRFPRYLPPPFNAQFAVQPYGHPHHEHHYQIKPSYVPLFHQFTWYPPSGGVGNVHFETRRGSTGRAPLLTRWTYHGANDPTDKNMYLYLTLWLNHGEPPTGGTHAIILRSLHYRLL